MVDRNRSAAALEPGRLAVTHLANFIGIFANRHVLSALARGGHAELRESHGFLFQHLLGAPRSVSELSKLMGITQQAVSKSVAELVQAGYLESQAGADARVKLVQLSERGRAALRSARRARAGLERRIEKRLGKARTAALRQALSELLQELGGFEAVATRRVPSVESK
ncbi:MAG: MarR family transcriptional regulator [Polyangiaceae bacterium]